MSDYANHTSWTLADPDTPFAAVDLTKARRNIGRLGQRLDSLGVALRPHVKTAKSIPAAQLMQGGRPGPITVSTMHEAEVFAEAGYRDITYAVGLDPHKLPRVIKLARSGVTVNVLLDSLAQAQAVTAASVEAGRAIPALIELDCDGHRGGIGAEHPALVPIGTELASQNNLAGVLVHAGESYFTDTPEAQQAAAHHERDAAVAAARRLGDAGLPAGVVSVGSTPTAHAATDLTGVTEVRAGNYVFFDLVMAGIGVCTLDDLALSVVVTVIGHKPEYGWILTDGGWMALSRDRGTANQAQDQGYGLVTGLDGNLLEGLVVHSASQEHGVIAAREGAQLPDLPIGTRLRVLPNHACATAAQFPGYHVISDDEQAAEPTQGVTAPVVGAFWDRTNGW